MKDIYNKLLAYNETGKDIDTLSDLESGYIKLEEQVQLIDEIIASVGQSISYNPINLFKNGRIQKFSVFTQTPYSVQSVFNNLIAIETAFWGS